MKTDSNSTGHTDKLPGLLGLSLCALCCALPIVGFIGGAGLLAGIAFYAEKIAVVLLIAATAFAIEFYRKRKACSCKVNCDCKEAPSKP